MNQPARITDALKGRRRGANAAPVGAGQIAKSSPCLRALMVGCSVLSLIIPSTFGMAEEASTVETSLRLERDLRAAQVFSYLQQADQAKREQRFTEAGEILRAAERLEPHSIAIASRLRALQRFADPSLGDGDSRLQTPSSAAAGQLAQAEMRVYLRRIEALLTQGDYAEAERVIDIAGAHLQQFRAQMDGDQAEALTQLHGRAAARLNEVREQQARGRRDAAADRASAELQALQARERSRFEARLERVIDVMQRGHYQLALAQSRQLVADYPDQASAEQLYNRLLERVYQQRALSLEQRERHYRQEVFERVNRALIPTGLDGRPIYPEDWRRREARTGALLEMEEEVPEWQLRLLDRLSDRLTIDVEDVDPAELLDMLASRAGINLVVHSDVRMAANPPISLHVRQMRLDNILNWVCHQLGVNWSLSRQAVVVGGPQEATPVLQIYDLTEIITEIPDLAGPDISTFQMDSGTGGGSGFDLFGGMGGFDQAGIGAEDVVDLIREAVDPRAWDNPDYVVEVRGGQQLLVVAPPRLHGLIQQFLRSQMGVNRTMVHTRLRWLELSDRYIEEIGMNWGGLTGNLLQNPGLSPYGSQRRTGTTDAAATIINRLPDVAADIAPAVAMGGLNLQIARLSTLRLNSIFTAMEAQNRGREVAGIDLTTMNGQRGHAMFLNQVSYVADYSVEGTTLSPELQVLSVGTILDVRPYVSADRKYVTMDLRPLHSSVELASAMITTFVQAGAGILPLQFPIDLPNQQVQSVGTRVMIPDGGSIMVGGFTGALRQDAQANVPFLGHIPFLGRLFGRRGRYSQNEQLLLTVSVNIILYDEEEANL